MEQFNTHKKCRLKKSALPPLELIQIFWNAPSDALFDQNTIAAVTNHSTSWCENMRWRGGGIPYVKCSHKCLYRKRDVLVWLESHSLSNSTSEYKQGE